MGESIHDLMMDARLKRLPVPLKPYRCAACEENENERLDRSDKDSRYNYERYSHNFDCGGNNYAHIQWDYKNKDGLIHKDTLLEAGLICRPELKY